MKTNDNKSLAQISNTTTVKTDSINMRKTAKV